jgi:hypothetical protein
VVDQVAAEAVVGHPHLHRAPQFADGGVADPASTDLPAEYHDGLVVVGDKTDGLPGTHRDHDHVGGQGSCPPRCCALFGCGEVIVLFIHARGETGWTLGDLDLNSASERRLGDPPAHPVSSDPRLYLAERA